MKIFAKLVQKPVINFKKYLFFLMITIIQPMAIGSELPSTSYLDSQSFGKCIAGFINRSGGSKQLSERRASAWTMRNQILKESTEPPLVQPLGYGIFENIGWIMSKENALASIPLIDLNFLESESADNFSSALALFSLYGKEAPCKCDPIERTDLPNSVDDQMNLMKIINSPVVDGYQKRSNQALAAADPIVKWLLSKPARSISHWDLLKFATYQFNGDVMSAIGVLGELFFRETLYAVSRL